MKLITFIKSQPKNTGSSKPCIMTCGVRVCVYFFTYYFFTYYIFTVGSPAEQKFNVRL